MPGARLYLPAILVLFVVVGVAGVVASVRGDGPPLWFIVLWLGGVCWNAYWWGWRVGIEVAVEGRTLRWRTAATEGEVPVEDVLGISRSRMSRQMAQLRLRDRRPLQIPVRYGFGELERALAEIAPGAEIGRG
jgi:hypothetical protein